MQGGIRWERNIKNTRGLLAYLEILQVKTNCKQWQC